MALQRLSNGSPAAFSDGSPTAVSGGSPEQVQYLELDAVERDFYESVYRQTRARFDTYERAVREPFESR